MVISRSTYSGTGSYAGHWLGDNHSTWEDLYRSIAGFYTLFVTQTEKITSNRKNKRGRNKVGFKMAMRE